VAEGQPLHHTVDKPFVPGGKVPFVFRSLPGYTFYAARAEQEVIVDDPAGQKRWLEGWIQITYLRDGEDEEQGFGTGFAGPLADS
jgi:hypothetical protein